MTPEERALLHLHTTQIAKLTNSDISQHEDIRKALHLLQLVRTALETLLLKYKDPE